VLTLTATLNRSPVDRGLGIVRLHRQTVAALGLAPWAPVVLRGRRTTGATVAFAPEDTPPGTALCEEVLLLNLGLPDTGGLVEVVPAAVETAQEVTVAGPAAVTAVVDPALLREALLGKWVTPGDDVSLLLHDRAPERPSDVAATRTRLSNRLGPGWHTHRLRVTGTHPAGPVLVTMGTTVGWDGGTSTTGSATPVLPAQAPSGDAAAPARRWPICQGWRRRGGRCTSGSTSASTTRSFSAGSAPPPAPACCSPGRPARARPPWSRSSRPWSVRGCRPSGRRRSPRSSRTPRPSS
jgi:transitional endoplasmic reticulum ATPase